MHTDGIRPALWLLLPVAAIVTIANEWVDGTWHTIFAVLIGVMWVALGLAVAYYAFVRNWRTYHKNRKYLEGLIASDNPEVAADASSALGVLLAVKRDWAGARAAFQRAINSGAPDTVAMAAFNLGLMHHNAGQLEAAIPAYQRAIDSDHVNYRPMSANNLGQVFQKLGRIPEARAAFQIAADSSNPKQAAFAKRSLAQL